jgi:hypothetical protein
MPQTNKCLLFSEREQTSILKCFNNCFREMLNACYLKKGDKCDITCHKSGKM